MQVLEGGDRIGEEHHAEARKDRVERLLEGERLRVGAYERDARIPGALARRGKQRFRDVEAEDPAGRSDGLGELQGRLAAAAADVEDVLTDSRSERFERRAPQRIELTIEPLPLRHPDVRGGAVPVVDLLRVDGHGMRGDSTDPNAPALARHGRTPVAAIPRDS